MPRFGLVGEDSEAKTASSQKSPLLKADKKKKVQTCVLNHILKISLSVPTPTDTAHISNSTNAHEHCPHQRGRRNQGAGIHLPAPECICPNLREKHTHKKREKMTFGSSMRSEG